MKKYLLVSLTILFAAAFVWADEAAASEPKVDIEADATVSWGIDFGKGKDSKTMQGFKNEASWNVKFPLIKKGDKTSTKGDVPMYGEVTIKDIEMNIGSKDGKAFGLNGKVGSLEAKFVFYGAYITAYDSPSFKSNYANLWDPLEKDGAFKKKDYKIEPGFDGAGVTIGYMNKDLMDLDVGVKLGSNGSWDAEASTAKEQYWKYFDGKTPLGDKEKIPGYDFKDKIPPKGTYLVEKNDPPDGKQHSQYGIGLDFSMKPLDKMLALKFTVNSTLVPQKGYAADSTKSDKFVLSVGAEVTSEPIDGLKLKLGFDGGSPFKDGGKTDQFGWDMLFGAGYKWISGGVYVASADTKLHGTDKDGKSITDMAFYTKFETKGEAKDASNLVNGLDAGAYVGMYKVLTFAQAKKDIDPKPQLPMLLKLWGAYQLNVSDSMWIKPFADVWAETGHTRFKDQNNLSGATESFVAMAYDVGVTFSPVEKVEITAKWAHGKVEEKNRYNAALDNAIIENTAFGDKATNHYGTFTFALKVIY